MTYTVDTAILGGGPAGMACALALQQRKIDALVIEKRRFPRDKTCGGLVTQKTVEQLQTLVDPARLAAAFCDESAVLELFDRDRPLTRSALQYRLRSVKRRDFDAFLAGEYRAHGGQLLENCFCRDIDPKRRSLTLSNGDTVQYRHLVAADGALSQARTMLGYPAPPLAFCVETHIPKAKLPDQDAVRVVFGLMEQGYAWVFPSGEELCIGLGSLYSKKQDYMQSMRDFLRLLGLAPEDAEIKGAFVPYGKVVRQRRSQRDVLLVGDAGGFIDPIYGEGLFFAVTSGKLAAEAIAACPENALAAYRKRMKPYRAIVRQGRLAQRMFFAPWVQQCFLAKIKNKHALAGFYADRQLAFYGYSYLRISKLLSDYRTSGKTRTENR